VQKKLAFVVWMFLAVSNATASMITVFPSISPNQNLPSPSADAYLVNAVFAIENGLTSYIGGGDPAGAQYTQTNSILPGDVIVTAFESWRGDAPPPAAYAGEYGNMLLFGVFIQSDAGFTLSDVTYYEDFFGNLDSFTMAGQQFNFDLVGVNYGGDGALGGGDDTRYDTPGGASDDSTLIHAMYFAGFGNAFSAANQTELDNAKAYVAGYGSNPAAVGAYSIPDAYGEGSVAVVPEPAAFVTLPFGLAALWAVRRRRAA